VASGRVMRGRMVVVGAVVAALVVGAVVHPTRAEAGASGLAAAGPTQAMGLDRAAALSVRRRRCGCGSSR
jgi:hypothetical protein